VAKDVIAAQNLPFRFRNSSLEVVASLVGSNRSWVIPLRLAAAHMLGLPVAGKFFLKTDSDH